MLKQPTKIAIICLLFNLGFGHCVQADDSWTQWRGPNRDGTTKAPAPDQWPKQLTRVWNIEVGEGHASPLVADSNVFVFTRQGNSEVALCLDLRTGKTIWKQQYDAPYTMNSAARQHGKGPKSTPVFFAGKLYTFGISGILSCFDAKNGDLKWRNDFSKQFGGALPLYGTAMSPMVSNGILIVHVGGHDNGSLKTFDAETGKEKWSWSEDGPAYTSPIVATFDGIDQIITQTQNKCVSLALNTGNLLWQLTYTTAWDQNSVTPIVYGDSIIFSGLKNGTHAYRPIRDGDSWTIEQAWHNKDESMYMSSPIITDNLLIGFAHTQKGHFFCLNLENGQSLWQSEGRQSDNAAIINTNNGLLAQKTDGEIIIFEKNAESFNPIAQYQVANSPTWAHPALIANHLITKDLSNLTFWRLH